MSDDAPSPDDAPQKASPVMSIVFGLVSAIVMAGVAAGVVMFAPLPEKKCTPSEPLEMAEVKKPKEKKKSYEDAVFLNLNPLVVTLGPKARSKYLKIAVTLQTSKDHVDELERLEPKFRDVLNTYLRAVDENDLIEPSAMTRLRAQLLRRIQIVAPSEAVSDVLITEFVLK